MQELEDLEERLARGILCRPDAASDTLPHNANLSLWVLYHVFPYKSTHVFVLGDSFFVRHVIDNHIATSSLYKTLVILKCLRSKKKNHLYSRSNRHYSKIGHSRNQEAIISSFEGQLGPSLTHELFLKLPSKCQDTLAGLCGLTGWGPILVHQISLAFEDKPLPSPSEMRWQDVPCILLGTIPTEHSTPIIQVEPLLESLKTYMK